MSRIEHADWTCPICDARGHCIECASLGTADSYHRVQELHEAAIARPDGIAAKVLDTIEYMPDLQGRAFWVDRLITGALRMGRAL